MQFKPYLRPGEALYRHPSAGQANTVLAANEAFTLILQDDSNLVLYKAHLANPYAHALWQTDTVGTGAQRCLMQDDGNLVLYSPLNVPIWNARTAGAPGAFLIVQDDGNCVIYTPGNVPIWQTHTVTKPGPLQHTNG